MKRKSREQMKNRPRTELIQNPNKNYDNSYYAMFA